MEYNSSGIKRQNLSVYLFYVLLVWLAWYLKMGQFGFYEDDYYYAVIPANMGFIEILGDVWNKLIDFQTNQGRFIGYTVPFFLTHIMYQIGGLTMVYLFGIFLVAFNAWLFYRFFSRFGTWWFGILAGLVFIVFPADTTKALIVHIYQLQLSLTFTLLAFLAFERRKVLAYFLAFASLLTYENAFLGFLFIPFLRMNLFNWKSLRKWVGHAIICLSFILIVFLIRKATGENRVAEVGADSIPKIFLGLIYGPLVSLFAYFNAALETISDPRATWAVFAVLFILIGAVVYVLKGRMDPGKLKFGKEGLTREWQKFPDSYLYLALVGLLMMSAGYLLSFTHYPPRALSGRGTSVHLGASIGSVLFFSSAWMYLLSVVGSPGWRKVLTVVLVGWISVMGARGILIQNSFAESWTLQKKLYAQIFEVAADMDEHDLLLFENQEIEKGTYIRPISWQFPQTPELLLDIPANITEPPRMVYMEAAPADFFSVNDTGTYFVPEYPFLYGDRDTVYLQGGELIYLRLENGHVRRVDQDAWLKTHDLTLKIMSPEQKLRYLPRKVTTDFLPDT